MLKSKFFHNFAHVQTKSFTHLYAPHYPPPSTNLISSRLHIASLFTAFVLLLSLCACSDSEPESTEKVGTRINPLVGSLKIPSNVSSVCHITNGADSRAAESEDGWYFVDLDGNKSELAIVAEDGRQTNLKIQTLHNLGAEYMMFVLDPYSVAKVFGMDDYSGDILEYCVHNWFIINKTSGKAFRLYSDYADGSFDFSYLNTDTIADDSKGNIYFSDINQHLFRLNPRSLEFQNMLPESEYCMEFWCDSDGLVGYRPGNRPGLSFLNTNGGITNISGHGFSLNGRIYSAISGDAIYECHMSGANIETRKVCEFPEFGFEINFINIPTKQIVLFNLNNGTYAFDGSSITGINCEVSALGYNYRCASDGYYNMIRPGYICILDFNTLDIRQFDVSSKYDILDFYCDKNLPGATFTALRFSDMSKVIATVDINGNITEISSIPHDKAINRLIPLN